jgi:hypothetical protein
MVYENCRYYRNASSKPKNILLYTKKIFFSLSSSRCHLSEKYPIIVDYLRMYDRLHSFGSILTQFEHQALTKETNTFGEKARSLHAYLPYFFPESRK